MLESCRSVDAYVVANIARTDIEHAQREVHPRQSCVRHIRTISGNGFSAFSKTTIASCTATHMALSFDVLPA